MRPALQPIKDELLALTDPALKSRALQIMAVFDLDVPAAITAAAAQDPATPPAVRLQSLRLLASQHSSAAERLQVLKKLLSDPFQSELRIESLAQMVSLDPAAGLAAADSLIRGGRLEEQQAAVAQMSIAKTPAADARLAMLLTPAGDAAAAPPGIRLDVREAAAVRAGEVRLLASALAAREKTMADATDPLAALIDCTTGGDPAAGRAISLENNAANCVACHRFQKGAGSAVGPPLENIAVCKMPPICWKHSSIPPP